jgi:hypothetical protein
MGNLFGHARTVYGIVLFYTPQLLFLRYGFVVVRFETLHQLASMVTWLTRPPKKD